MKSKHKMIMILYPNSVARSHHPSWGYLAVTSYFTASSDHPNHSCRQDVKSCVVLRARNSTRKRNKDALPKTSSWRQNQERIPYATRARSCGRNHLVKISVFPPSSRPLSASNIPRKARIACWKPGIALRDNIGPNAASEIGPPLFAFLVLFSLFGMQKSLLEDLDSNQVES